jgi:hypothetical protein
MDKQKTVNLLDQVITCFPQQVLSLLIYEYMGLPPVEFPDDYQDSFVHVTKSKVNVVNYSSPWLWIPAKTPLRLSEHSFTLLNVNVHSWMLSLTTHFEIRVPKDLSFSAEKHQRRLVRFISHSSARYIHVYVNLKRHSIVTIFANDSGQWSADEMKYELDDETILSCSPCVGVGWVPQTVELIPKLPVQLLPSPTDAQFDSWNDMVHYGNLTVMIKSLVELKQRLE